MKIKVFSLTRHFYFCLAEKRKEERIFVLPLVSEYRHCPHSHDGRCVSDGKECKGNENKKNVRTEIEANDIQTSKKKGCGGEVSKEGRKEGQEGIG